MAYLKNCATLLWEFGRCQRLVTSCHVTGTLCRPLGGSRDDRSRASLFSQSEFSQHPPTLIFRLKKKSFPLSRRRKKVSVLVFSPVTKQIYFTSLTRLKVICVTSHGLNIFRSTLIVFRQVLFCMSTMCSQSWKMWESGPKWEWISQRYTMDSLNFKSAPVSGF